MLKTRGSLPGTRVSRTTLVSVQTILSTRMLMRGWPFFLGSSGMRSA